jgi:hypothetical protein
LVGLVAYDAEDSYELEKAYLTGVQTVKVRGGLNEVDLQTMQQKNLATSVVREVKRIDLDPTVKGLFSCRRPLPPRSRGAHYRPSRSLPPRDLTAAGGGSGTDDDCDPGDGQDYHDHGPAVPGEIRRGSGGGEGGGGATWECLAEDGSWTAYGAAVSRALEREYWYRGLISMRTQAYLAQ